jgi:serine/threonine protein kinase
MDTVTFMSDSENGFRAPQPGELAPLFPKYRILSLIATGGMGAVYHAIQTSLEREVAIKILPAEFGKDAEFREAFAAEARAMAKLKHPNLIGVYDYGDVNGMLFIVMEHVSGQSVHDACQGCAVDPAEVIRLMTKICQGMAHAHENGILHRDIKPANILLDAHLQPKIGDFGLARPIESKVGEGEAIYGTPGYTAPEVLDAPHTMDQRADIFSLGVLLHELLTGLLPSADPRPPSVISKCDPRFDAVVRKATQPDPLQRYQSAEEIAEALQKIASSMGSRPGRTSSPAASRMPAARFHPTQTPKKGGSGVWIMLVIIAGAVAVFLLKNGDSPVTVPITSSEPVAGHKPEPAQPEVAPPEPVKPNPAPSTPVPDPIIPDPGPVVSVTDPVNPTTVPEPPAPEPVNPEPGPTVTEPVAAAPVTSPQPKFDVEGFLAHARAIMVKRCAPEFIKERFHDAAGRELDAFLDLRRADGNRMGEQLEKPLKFKKWLVELHEKHQKKEAGIDEDLKDALAEHQNTYLHGLGLRIKALQADDPVAAELIKAETGTGAASPDYFVDLMREGLQKN